MVTVKNIRPVILTGQYGFDGCAENALHLPHGLRCCSMVEVTLSNGIKGIGEGYLGVFAPDVFRSIVELIAPTIAGSDISSGYQTILTKAKNMTAYWSLQGAAQHVISAVEIALVDAYAKLQDKSAIELFGGSKVNSIAMYGSGGDSLHPRYMKQELKQLAQRGIRTIKIRARHNQIDKTVWTINAAKQHGIRVAVDMTQNLAVNGQTPIQVSEFCQQVKQQTGEELVFVEECLGLDKLAQLPLLAQQPDIHIAGGEIVTTKEELFERLDRHCYNIVQPDASVLGGIQNTIEVCRYAQNLGVDAVVHSWGGAVAMMANYIAAFASGCSLIEYPMPSFALRPALFNFDQFIENGHLRLPDSPGIGIELNSEVEQEFSFKPEAIYHCSPLESGLNALEESHQDWKDES
ncbi:enolase C-terminal domain-like protein [Vibrio scophthalmi]|uniref:enolase C-terminal domain-like protein n=1 Tax=Vibrio scophthalmi TaxID=45658 RepID=UPI003EB6D1E6